MYEIIITAKLTDNVVQRHHVLPPGFIEQGVFIVLFTVTAVTVGVSFPLVTHTGELPAAPHTLHQPLCHGRRRMEPATQVSHHPFKADNQLAIHV